MKNGADSIRITDAVNAPQGEKYSNNRDIISATSKDTIKHKEIEQKYLKQDCSPAVADGMATINLMLSKDAKTMLANNTSDTSHQTETDIQKMKIDALKPEDIGQASSGHTRERSWSALLYQGLTQGRALLPDAAAKFASEVQTSVDFVKRNPMQCLAYGLIMASNYAVASVDARSLMSDPTSGMMMEGENCKQSNAFRNCNDPSFVYNPPYAECPPCTYNVGTIAGTAIGGVMLCAVAVGICCHPKGLTLLCAAAGS